MEETLKKDILEVLEYLDLKKAPPSFKSQGPKMKKGYKVIGELQGSEKDLYYNADLAKQKITEVSDEFHALMQKNPEFFNTNKGQKMMSTISYLENKITLIYSIIFNMISKRLNKTSIAHGFIVTEDNHIVDFSSFQNPESQPDYMFGMMGEA